MSTGTAKVNTVADYINSIKDADPARALELAILETERQRAVTAEKEAEYRAFAELEFDADGRIVKANMAGLWRLANSYARSKIVPEQYRGNPDDCFIACQMAFRWKADPMMVMQCSYIVHGKPGIEGKLAIALINSSGKIKGRVRYKFTGEGKNRACTAFATDKETGDVVESTVTWAMAEAEGWTKKAGSKWLTIPDVMFTYRSATFMVRQYFPEVLMGMRTVDELHDTQNDDGPRTTARTLDDLADELGGDVRQEQSQSDTITETTSPKLEEKQSTFSLDNAGADFSACTSLGEVTKLSAELEAAGIPEDHRAAVAGMQERARERIAASRGKRQTAGAGA